MSQSHITVAIASLTLIGLGGGMVGPDYKRHDATTIPTAYANATIMPAYEPKGPPQGRSPKGKLVGGVRRS